MKVRTSVIAGVSALTLAVGAGVASAARQAPPLPKPTVINVPCTADHIHSIWVCNYSHIAAHEPVSYTTIVNRLPGHLQPPNPANAPPNGPMPLSAHNVGATWGLSRDGVGPTCQHTVQSPGTPYYLANPLRFTIPSDGTSGTCDLGVSWVFFVTSLSSPPPVITIDEYSKQPTPVKRAPLPSPHISGVMFGPGNQLYVIGTPDPGWTVDGATPKLYLNGRPDPYGSSFQGNSNGTAVEFVITPLAGTLLSQAEAGRLTVVVRDTDGLVSNSVRVLSQTQEAVSGPAVAPSTSPAVAAPGNAGKHF